MTSRWVTRLRSEGDDPDPRFTFANERTFLAWIRTALALIAGGIGLEAFLTDEMLPPPARRTIAILLLLLGAFLAVAAFRRWLQSERALRLHEPLPLPWAAPVLAGGVGLAALVLIVFVAIQT